MGASASVNPKYPDVDRARTSGRHRNGADSSRSGRSTNSGSSVRRMALMNHARQENSYIPQDILSANFLKKSLRVPGESKFSKLNEEVVVEIPKSEYKIDNPSGSKVDDIETEPSVRPGFVFLKPNGFGLKINIEDETDWVQVADDEAEDELDQAVFDMNLITLPSSGASSSNLDIPIVIPRSDKVPVNNDNKNSQQFIQNGTMYVDGIKVAIGINGIIRPDAVTGHMPKTNHKLPMRERLIVLCKLGQGASSIVYKALDLTDMKLVALKMIHVNDKDKRVQMVRELCALFQLLRENSRKISSHAAKVRRPEKYIVDFYDAFSNLEDGMVSLMIEYMDGGSLEDIVDQGGCDDEPTLANIAIQALKGLSFLHSCGQIHRDLKPGNFLISHRGEVKVADLGIMKQLNMTTGAKKGLLPKTNTFVGTATYMSPERIDGKEYSFPSDVWAFGLSLVTIALGRLPIDTQGGYWTILHNIRDAPPPTLPSDIFSADFRDFVGLCLKRNPDERHTCAQLLKHPFLHKVVAEDLTYDQNYDRGKNELLSILLAVFTHIKQIKANILEALNSRESGVDVEAYRNHRLYGDLTCMSAIDILHKVLFGGEPHQSSVAASKDSIGGVDKPGEYTRGSSRPRLTNLAKQLHLPIDKVVHEAKQYFELLKRDHLSSGN